ncbi:hypothetical protein PAEPH01_1821 [Pancytospora epiphaga]|nr:hypothetical protein PAEPH01_1821 [Pancytospora epiphaga]
MNMEQIISKVCVLQYINEWRDTELEGTLYIYKKKRDGPLSMYLPSKHGVENFTMNVANGSSVERHGRLLILEDTTELCHFGFWFDKEADASKAYGVVSGFVGVS